MTLLIIAVALIVAAVMVVAAINMYDARRYQICDECRHNLATYRPSFFGSDAYCVKHGPL